MILAGVYEPCSLVRNLPHPHSRGFVKFLGESAFLAKNESYTWGVSQGQSAIQGKTSAYADTWEIADSCNKNSFAIGLAQPWNIPNNSNGFEQVLVSINAPAGTQPLGRLGGAVTLNDNAQCQYFPTQPLAQCMGDALLSPSQPVEAGRLFLLEGRRWFAGPNKCWVSQNSGWTDPALTIPFDHDGCY